MYDQTTYQHIADAICSNDQNRVSAACILLENERLPQRAFVQDSMSEQFLLDIVTGKTKVVTS